MYINKQDITIFIVDDEFVIRDSLTLLLETHEFKVQSYDSALHFLEHFNPNQPGCLVLDMRMPYMDGLDLQEELSKINAELPIIFISGHADVQLSSKAFRAGAMEFLEKPFDNKLLLERINEAIKNLILNWPNILEKKLILERYAQLTLREKEVFMLIVSNNSNKQAAKVLGISNRTVDAHRAHIMKKMQADSLNSLIMMNVTAQLF